LFLQTGHQCPFDTVFISDVNSNLHSSHIKIAFILLNFRTFLGVNLFFDDQYLLYGLLAKELLKQYSQSLLSHKL